MEKNKDEQNYPGYPHYPENEDITRSDNNNGTLRLKEEIGEREPKNELENTKGTDEEIVMGTDADVTDADLKVLDSEGELPDSGLDETDEDGDALNEADGRRQLGDALDVPGSEDDDMNELIGEEDEENNYYSLGDTEDVEEDDDSE